MSLADRAEQAFTLGLIACQATAYGLLGYLALSEVEPSAYALPAVSAPDLAADDPGWSEVPPPDSGHPV
ncbi:hypothetical protein [Streptomyces sp. NPDC056883]|uniref:hypothetical protein n=1 Tax=Streptomyces sp. NPDC056883 TaxID=3345959 RepID=UPI003677FA68